MIPPPVGLLYSTLGTVYSVAPSLEVVPNLRTPTSGSAIPRAHGQRNPRRRSFICMICPFPRAAFASDSARDLFARARKPTPSRRPRKRPARRARRELPHGPEGDVKGKGGFFCSCFVGPPAARPAPFSFAQNPRRRTQAYSKRAKRRALMTTGKRGAGTTPRACRLLRRCG